MAGHSKFKNIMHRKGAQDKKRAKVFSRLGREISVAVKVGGEDIESNIRLRSAIASAKSLNMPKDNIERAIKKGQGNDPDNNYEEVRYEGYGPEGIAIIVEALTNNKNRTAAEIRSSFSKYGGNLGETGSVSFGFDRFGNITLDKSLVKEDQLLEFLIENNTEDYEINEATYHEIIAKKKNGYNIVCVGTTTLRTLEHVNNTSTFKGKTNLFITKGFKFNVADYLITNFHAPKSSLLSIVQTIYGDSWKKLYAFALENNMKFLSFGDAVMFKIKNNGI